MDINDTIPLCLNQEESKINDSQPPEFKRHD